MQPHDRRLDHYDVEGASTAVLASPIGRYPSGMSAQDVLADLVARLRFVETTAGVLIFSFTGDAVLFGSATRSFIADAFVAYPTGGFTADAMIGTTFSFIANAVLISDPEEGCV